MNTKLVYKFEFGTINSNSPRISKIGGATVIPAISCTKELPINVSDVHSTSALYIIGNVNNERASVKICQLIISPHTDPGVSKRIFHTLTLGKQRTLLHLIGKPKSGEVRLRKAIAVINYLKEVNGRLDFKELNLAIKTGNQRF